MVFKKIIVSTALMVATARGVICSKIKQPAIDFSRSLNNRCKPCESAIANSTYDQDINMDECSI